MNCKSLWSQGSRILDFVIDMTVMIKNIKSKAVGNPKYREFIDSSRVTRVTLQRNTRDISASHV